MTHEQIKDLIDLFYVTKGYATDVDLDQSCDGSLEFSVTVKFSKDSKEDPTFFVYPKTKKVSIMAFYYLNDDVKEEEVEPLINELSKDLPEGYEIDVAVSGSKDVTVCKTISFDKFNEDFLGEVESMFTKPNKAIARLRSFDTK